MLKENVCKEKIWTPVPSEWLSELWYLKAQATVLTWQYDSPDQ